MHTVLLAAALLLGTGNPAGTVRGVVTDADGTPLAGVMIVMAERTAPPGGVVEATTDGEGRFAIAASNDDLESAGQPAQWDHVLVAYKPGLAVSGASIRSAPAANEPLRIVLGPAERVSVQLVGPDGDPLPGIDVVPDFIYVDRLNVGNAHLLGRLFSRRTDADGRAAWDMLPADASFMLRATTLEHGTQRVYLKVGEAAQTFALRSTGRLLGRVTAGDSNAVRDLQVSVSSRPALRPDQQGPRATTGLAEVRTDAEGRFEIPALAEGEATLTIQVDSTSRFRAKESPTVAVVASQTTEVVVPLIHGTIVRGVVLERESAKPMPGVPIYLWSRSGESYELATDANGSYEARVGPGQFWAQVRSLPSPYIPPIEDTRGGTIEPGTEGLTLEPIRMSRGGKIHGTVVDENNRPVAGAWVTAGWTQREGSMSTTAGLSTRTDEEGKFVLEPVAADVELRLRSDTRERASLERTTVSPGHSEPIRLVVTPEGVAPVAARVVDDRGHPVAGAQVTIRAGSRSLAGGRRWQSGPEFDNEWSLTTGADGRFATPHPLPRSNKTLLIEAEGMVRHQATFEPGSRDPEQALGEIVLKRVLRIAGRVVDRDGRPVAQATASAHGKEQNSGMAATTTDTDGRFALEDAHPDARLLFVRKDGFRFHGSVVSGSTDAVTITLTRADEPPTGEPLSTRKLPDDRRQKLRKNLLLPVYERQQEAQGDYFRREILELLVPQDRQHALERLIDLRTAQARSELLLALGEIEDALAQAGDVANPYSRTYAFLNAADAVKEPAERLKVLGDALLHARAEPNPARRVVLFGNVAERLIDAGERKSAESVLADALEPATQLATTDWAGFARGHFAETLALIDVDDALALVKELQEDRPRDRHHGNIAHELAGLDPQQAERVLKLVKPGYERDRYAQRVCYRMAPVDLDRARRVAAEIQDQPFRVHALGVMALALAEKDPAAARGLLREAFGEAEQSTRAAHDRQRMFPTAAVLVRYSETVDPEATAQYLWRAAALHPGPQLEFFGYQRQQLERDSQAARLILLLALYGVAPELTDQLAAPIFERAERYDPQEVYHQAPPVYAALALADPERAVDWHARFLKKVDDERLRIVRPPQAWRTMAAMFAPEAGEIWRFLQVEMFHVWDIDREDL